MLNEFMTNFVTICILVGFIIIQITADVFETRTKRFFAYSTVSVIFLLFLEIIDSTLETQDTLNNIRYLTLSLTYILRIVPLAIYISIIQRNRKNIFVFWIPILFISILLLINFWTNIMFEYDSNNNFRRGSFGFIPHVLSISYIITLAIYSIKDFKSRDKIEAGIILYVVLLSVLSGILETFHGYTYLLTGVITTGSTLYYIYLYVQIYKKDTTTDVFNRTTFNNDITKSTKKHMSIVSVDLNMLKLINDKQGHTAGDFALFTTAKILKASSQGLFKIYRVGGDEFIAIGIGIDETTTKNFINNAKDIMSTTEFMASFGYSLYKPGDILEEVFKSADADMYKDKKLAQTCI